MGKNSDVDGQEVLWAELDDSAEHKRIYKLAKDLRKIRDTRKEALTDSKAQEDKTQEELAKKMHEAGIECFKHKGVEARIKKNSEKVKVKLTDDSEDD